MNRPTIEDLEARFEEMKAEQDYIRSQFFEKLFSVFYPDKGHKIHQKLKDEGPPDTVMMHPSMVENRMGMVALAEYCIVRKNPLLKENEIIFLWWKDRLVHNQKAPLQKILSPFKNN